MLCEQVDEYDDEEEEDDFEEVSRVYREVRPMVVSSRVVLRPLLMFSWCFGFCFPKIP